MVNDCSQLHPFAPLPLQDPIYIWTYRVCLENLVKFLIPFVLMFFFNAGIIKALRKSRRFRQSMSERRSLSAGPHPDKPWSPHHNRAGNAVDNNKRLAAKNDEHLVAKEKDGGGRNIDDVDDVDDDYYHDSRDSSDTKDRKLEPGSNVAEKSYDMEEDSVFIDYDDKRKMNPGSNIAQKSFDIRDTDDSENSVPRIVVNNRDPLGAVGEAEPESSCDRPSELRSTPSPAGTPVMGIRRQSPSKKRPSPVRIHTPASQNESQNDEGPNCPSCIRICCRCFSIKGNY